MSKVITQILVFATLLWTISSAPVDFNQQVKIHIFDQNPTCVYANLLPYFNKFHYSKNETEGIHGYISSCYFDAEQTIIKGRFVDLPNDSQKENYHFYLLNPDNSLRRDLSQLFQRGLIINKHEHSAELLLNLKTSSDFPLDGINSYVNGWIKLYHLHDSVVSSAGPAQFHKIGNLIEKEL